MAPENMEGKGPHYRQPPADVFSFGCVLYELATGKCPWKDEGESWSVPQFVTTVHVLGKRPPLGPVKHAPLRAIIERCWLADPAARPTAEALVALAKKGTK